jgi:hypothetical protein
MNFPGWLAFISYIIGIGFGMSGAVQTVCIIFFDGEKGLRLLEPMEMILVGCFAFLFGLFSNLMKNPKNLT